MIEKSIFRQLAFDFGQTTRDTPAPNEILGIPEVPDSSRLPFYDLLGPLGGFVRSIFERMEIAGQVIEEKKSIHSQHGDRIERSFPLLCGTEVLEQASHRLYRKHCEHIIDRVVNGKDTRLPTKAELVAALSGISLIAPVKPYVTCLYWRLFTELFPADAQRIEDADLSDTMLFSSYDHTEADELERGLSRWLIVKDRMLRS